MNKKSKVILLPCNSYREELVYENLETGLELLGSLESIVGKEESVLLKPNLLKKAEVDKAVITHPVIVGMFARLMREKGYQDIILADSCGNGTTTKVMSSAFPALPLSVFADESELPLEPHPIAIVATIAADNSTPIIFFFISVSSFYSFSFEFPLGMITL